MGVTYTRWCVLRITVVVLVYVIEGPCNIATTVALGACLFVLEPLRHSGANDYLYQKPPHRPSLALWTS